MCHGLFSAVFTVGLEQSVDRPRLFRRHRGEFAGRTAGGDRFDDYLTNQITSLIAAGAKQQSAAVSSIRTLAITEIICIAAGVAIVLMLPKIRKTKEYGNEAQR